MLLKLAWRNIWRNKRRSLVVLISIIVGVNAILMIDGLTNGMIFQMLFNQISSNIAHVQVHKKGFSDNKVVQQYIPDENLVETVLKNNSSVRAYSKRVIAYGLLSSASNSTGVYVNGIIPAEEKKVSQIYNLISEGNYLTGNSHEAVIGESLAEKLDVGIGDKVVVMSNTPDGDIGADLFRITGLFKTAYSEFDKTQIYISLPDAQNLLDVKDKVYEFAVITDNYKNANKTRDEIAAKLTDQYEVLSYEDLLPFIILQMDLYGESMFIVNLIVGLALIFGIINSMLMAVFERINEFGVLMSIGMKNSRLFLMILTEALILGIFGTLIGVGSGILLNIPISDYGIDLSLFAAGLESFGVGAVIYPVLSIENVLITLIMLPFISVLGAVYPAYKAIKLEPVYAIRYV